MQVHHMLGIIMLQGDVVAQFIGQFHMLEKVIGGTIRGRQFILTLLH
ncbi:MAG: hypothetical protein ACI9LU_003095 [Polaribacter sp.]|jgi:hypothetical protein